MAKKSKSRRRVFFKKITHRAKKMTIPLAVVAGLVPGVTGTIDAYQTSKNIKSAGIYACAAYTGYNSLTNQWSLNSMKLGFVPLAIGVMVHKVAGMLGINKAIAGAGIPFVRI